MNSVADICPACGRKRGVSPRSIYSKAPKIPNEVYRAALGEIEKSGPFTEKWLQGVFENLGAGGQSRAAASFLIMKLERGLYLQEEDGKLIYRDPQE